jgi:hypothetical protein
VPVGVTQLVQTDHLIVGLHCLFVAFQRAVTSDTVPFEVGQQGDYSACTFFRLLQLGDVLDDGVRILPEELIHEGLVKSQLPQVHTPDCFLL